MDSGRIINSFEMEKRIGHLIIYWPIIFLALLLWKLNVFNISNMVEFSMIFVISRITEILIISNVWLKMYRQSILKARWNTRGTLWSARERASVALSAKQERHTGCVSLCLKTMWNTSLPTFPRPGRYQKL